MSMRMSHTMSSQVFCSCLKIARNLKKCPAFHSNFNPLVIDRFSLTGSPNGGPRSQYWENLWKSHPWLRHFSCEITTPDWDISVGESYSNAAANPDILKNASNQHLPGYLLLINILSSIFRFAIELMNAKNAKNVTNFLTFKWHHKPANCKHFYWMNVFFTYCVSNDLSP